MTPTEFKAIRKAMGLTQAQLAARMAYGSATRISEIENGKVPMPRLVALLMQAWGERAAHAATLSRRAPQR